MTITGSHYPLDIKVNNDHHGDLLPLGHLGCPSWGATTPWVKSNMGEPRPPEDIQLHHNHIAVIVSLWGDTLTTVSSIIGAFLLNNPSPTTLRVS
jgi:hypothetical protein